MLRKIIPIAALLAVALIAASAPRHLMLTSAQEVPPTEVTCCGKKPPKFPDVRATTTTAAQTYSTFTGQVAVVTGQLKGLSSVMMVDLKNENQPGVPIDSNWSSSSAPPTQTYTNPAWATKLIGDVFGTTLDDKGNVYVTATTSYTVKSPVNNAAGPGNVYRIDGTTGAVNVFASLPNKGPGLGNIDFSCRYQTFYVTNFADGRVYQMVTDNSTSPPTAKVVSAFSLATGAVATGFSSKNGDPEPGRDYSKFIAKNKPGTKDWGRPWAVKVVGDHVMIGVWRQDFAQHTGVDAQPNEVWSVKLTPVGGFVANSQHVEITMPALQTTNPTSPAKNYSNPVSSISRSPANDLLVTERSMNGDFNSPYQAHESRGLEYALIGSTWTLQNPTKFGLGTLFSTNKPSDAGGGDFDMVGGLDWFTADAMHLGANDYLYGIQGVPMSGGTIHNSILIDLTDSTTTIDKNQMGDVEIPCPDCGAVPTPTPATECCDKIAAVPHPQQNVSLDYRTFTITNLKAPQSNICYIDISMNPPPSTGWQGGDLYVDGGLIPTATRFVTPYTRIPNKGATTISALNSVTFNLGVDYTLSPPWTGTTTFVVHHCDGTTCTLSSGPWSALPPVPVPGTKVFDINMSQEGKLYTIGLQLKQRDLKTPIQWIGFTVGDEKDQIFAATAPRAEAARGRTVADAILENSGLSEGAVLYTFAQPLKTGAASNFNMVVRRGSDATPLIHFTTYDARGNAIETGTITGPAPR